VPKHSVVVNIISGKMECDDPLTVLFKDLKDGRYFVEVSTTKKRTNPQNRYYHGLVVPMIRKGIEEMGTELTNDETHEFLKARFNYAEIVNTSTGEMERIPKSTARLSTVQFNEFIVKIQHFAAEFLGIVIPDPNEQMKMAF
jgi:hypothetical protein